MISSLRSLTRHPLPSFRLLQATTMSAQYTTWRPNNYPPTRRSDHVDIYQSNTRGPVRVHDPYQWLEQNSEETEKWVTAQEEYTRGYLDQNAERKALEDQIRNATNYAKVCPLPHAEILKYYLIGFLNVVFSSFSERRRPLVLVLQQWPPSSVRLSTFTVTLLRPHSLRTLVLYRSKDSTIPSDFADNGPGGEIFFDVGSLHASLLSLSSYFLPP